MTVKYKTVITKAGAEKLAAATVPNGKKVNFTAMAVGDGGGKLPVPDPNQTKLVKEVWRHALNKISQDKKNKNYVVAELLIPPETGGFWMRELGLYDDTGTLIAVGNMAESYKPALAEGSGRAQTVRMVIMVSDIESVELTIDTSTVMATQDYVDDKLAEHEKSRRHPDATLTAKGFTQLSSATDSASESVAGAVVAGALLIRKYWEPISAFFLGVVEGLKAAFAPVAEIFSPLTPVFDSIIEKLRGVWQWFTDLIAPVKETQETLDRCKNVGVAFGKALADALTAPLNVFNSLSGKVGWLLEKLGVIKKESDGLDQTAAKASAAAGAQNVSYIPQTSVYGGYQMYQPVTAPAGRSYVDQSKREYNITLSGGVAPGTDLDRQLREAVEKLDREERARQRSSMRHDG